MSDIDAMPPGADLDRLVAERVLGWRQHGTQWVSADGSVRLSAFRPSTDIAHAWVVVEAMATSGLAMSIDLDPTPYVTVSVSFTRPPGEIGGRAGATAAPIAICRAALKAVAG